MSSSVIDICNRGLIHIGAFPIQSLSEQTKEARLCNRFYPIALASTLRDFAWNFAKKNLPLALLQETFVGWEFVYAHPIDCLKARRIYDPTTDGTGKRYDTEAGAYVTPDPIKYEIVVSNDLSTKWICSNYEDAILIYTANVTNPNLFDMQFVDALGYRLGMSLAIPVKAKPALKQSLANDYAIRLTMAEASNANESKEAESSVSPYERARA